MDTATYANNVLFEFLNSTMEDNKGKEERAEILVEELADFMENTEFGQTLRNFLNELKRPAK